jgi:methylated-DNA-[protein]-cysteine S-methyltransferase
LSVFWKKFTKPVRATWNWTKKAKDMIFSLVMIAMKCIKTPLGQMTLVADADGLRGLYFPEHKPAPKRDDWQEKTAGPWLAEGQEWLAHYFAGKKELPLPPLIVAHGTDFQKRVWDALRRIPRGETRTYGDLAEQIGSPAAVRAVGAAVGRNPFSIFIPCHRVIGRDGSLTGFAGGVERKAWLLRSEGVDL